MPQLHFYVSDDIEAQLRLNAKKANLSLPKFIAEIVKREIVVKMSWPKEYFELFDAWQGLPAQRPSEGELESRESFGKSTC